ncbi:MAG: tRNA (N(6)-L-threonylcarbamoyladenosine(37)-C(2))-methylthiotransferase [Methanosarcinaceae archaeon]|nr:tRNA (N(6)-L-threonylcarbamoyladenosine(37)-C(2))-methylthiotransferase [Methanosarcinaceae archaeon]
MKVHVATYGCSANQASSETMMGTIQEMGHELVDKQHAEVVVLNTCTVKATTEQKILHEINRLGKNGMKLIVAGCMPQVQLNDILQNNPAAHILGVNSISRIGEILDFIENCSREEFPGDPAERFEIITSDPSGFLNTCRIRLNPNIHICQISQGCNYGCAYCIVREARGQLISFDPELIVEDIRTAVSEGCGEIWLTSQDDGQYGMDIGVRLPELLEMINSIPGNFMVRVGMMNPFSMLPILDDIIKAFGNDKVYKLLHLPIQSASEDVVKRMDRFYSMSDVDDIISRFRTAFPDLTLFTDIIVGFPGETESDFDKSVEWVQKYKPAKVNISRYTPRPHTKALEYRNIDSRIVAKRSNELHRVCQIVKLGSKEPTIGWQGEVFVSKTAKVKGVMARTASYKPVVIQECELSPGQWCKVKITDTTPGYFLGRIVE